MSLDFIRVGDKELSPGQKPVDCCQRFSFIILMTGASVIGWNSVLWADTKQEYVNFKFQSNWWLIRLKFLGKLILEIEKNAYEHLKSFWPRELSFHPSTILDYFVSSEVRRRQKHVWDKWQDLGLHDI